MRLLPLLLAATLALPAAAEVAYSPTLALQGGTALTDPAIGATFILIDVTDQRCPADVDCYWEGMMRIKLTVTVADGIPATVILCNQCEEGSRTAKVAGLTLQFDTLQPSTADLARLARLPVLSDYTARITLQRP